MKRTDFTASPRQGKGRCTFFGGEIILPSLFAAGRGAAVQSAQRCWRLNLRHLHYDVMDGRFVPSVGLDLSQMSMLRREMPDCCFDVHLMVEDPEAQASEAISCGATSLSFHPEASAHPEDLIAGIKARGVLAGIAVSPGVDIVAAFPWLTAADYAVVMLIEPGYSGQQSREEMIERLALLKQTHPGLAVIADGGVCADNIARILQAGADAVVVGAGLFKDDIEENHKSLIQAMEEN